MSYRFVDGFQAGPGWNIVKLVHLVGFIIKKFFMMHGHMNVKKNMHFCSGGIHYAGSSLLMV
jgi:hypothetical protein